MKRLMALIVTVSLCLSVCIPAKASAENAQSSKGSLSITLSKLTLKQKENLNFKVAFVVDAKPVKGQNLVIQVMDNDQGGVQVFEEQTDAKGEVKGTVKLTKQQPNGSYFLVATTKYQGTLVESRVGFTLGVPSQGKDLQTDKLTYKKGDIVTIKGVAIVDETPVQGAVIPIRVVVNERVVFVGEATMDDKGAFQISYALKGSTYGTYVVYASIPGSTTDELSASFKYSK